MANQSSSINSKLDAISNSVAQAADAAQTLNATVAKHLQALLAVAAGEINRLRDAQTKTAKAPAKKVSQKQTANDAAPAARKQKPRQRKAVLANGLAH